MGHYLMVYSRLGFMGSRMGQRYDPFANWDSIVVGIVVLANGLSARVLMLQEEAVVVDGHLQVIQHSSGFRPVL